MQVLNQSVMDPNGEDCFCIYQIIADKKKIIYQRKWFIAVSDLLAVFAIEFYPGFF